MNIFTYGDYIRSIHTIRLHAIMDLMEKNTRYEVINNTKEIEENIIYDKFIKQLLLNKREVINILNLIDLKKILQTNKKSLDEEDLIDCNKQKITKRLKSKEVDGLYKIIHNKKEIYIMLEYLGNNKENIEYKMLNYCIDIMQNWIRSKKDYTGRELENISIYPIIVPIVIYNEKENKSEISNKYLHESSSNYSYSSINDINMDNILSYNKLNINRYLSTIDKTLNDKLLS